MIIQHGEITQFIADALEKGYYVFLPVNTRYIHEYDFENYHEMMVYGHKDAILHHNTACQNTDLPSPPHPTYDTLYTIFWLARNINSKYTLYPRI